MKYLVLVLIALLPFALPVPETETCINAETAEVQVHHLSHELKQEQPKPKTMCYPLTKDKKPACLCLQQDKGEGCKNGMRDVEMVNCTVYCWKDMCACCKS